MRIYVHAAKEGIWPEFSVHGVRADFTRRHNSPLTPVEILWWTFKENHLSHWVLWVFNKIVWNIFQWRKWITCSRDSGRAELCQCISAAQKQSNSVLLHYWACTDADLRDQQGSSRSLGEGAPVQQFYSVKGPFHKCSSKHWVLHRLYFLALCDSKFQGVLFCSDVEEVSVQPRHASLTLMHLKH